MDRIKSIALVAHDNRKPDLTEWVKYNAPKLANHHLICTGTTGKMVEETLAAEGEIDILIFFWDPMQPQPHDVDVKALLRITVLYNVPTACNRSSADFLIDSPHFSDPYTPIIKDYSYYINRSVQ